MSEELWRRVRGRLRAQSGSGAASPWSRASEAAEAQDVYKRQNRVLTGADCPAAFRATSVSRYVPSGITASLASTPSRLMWCVPAVSDEDGTAPATALKRVQAGNPRRDAVAVTQTPSEKRPVVTRAKLNITAASSESANETTVPTGVWRETRARLVPRRKVV